MPLPEIRNPVYAWDGVRIDCEINHADFGWIPFTADADDPEAHGREIHAAILDGAAGVVAPYEPPPAIPPTPEELDAAARGSAEVAIRTVTAKRLVRDEALSDDDKLAIGGFFPRWKPDEAVAVGDIRRHGEGLYECIQAHTALADWEPQNTPALWNAIVEPNTIGPWVQPAGGHDAYQVGDLVTHNGQTWISTAANNVWEPGVFGWNVHAE